MVLNRNEIEKRCEDFFRLYDVTKGHIYDMCMLKIEHTYHVAENCYKIAFKERLTEYECDLAWVIGELHDFARFGQAIITKGIKDSKKFEHAKLGARMLFTHGLINDIIPNYSEINDEDKKVLEKAVYYHSAFHLPNNLTEREKLFCNIIRQADQLDIFRLNVEFDWKRIYGCDREELLNTRISKEIVDSFYQRTLVDHSKCITFADYHMAHIALCFGLYNRSTRKIALEQGYITKMMDITFSNPDVQKQYIEIKKMVEDYMYN